MKNYAVILLIFLCPNFPAGANVFNGFLIEKLKLEKRIETCEQLLEEAETTKSERKIEKELKKLMNQYEVTARKFEDTEKLINLIKHIDSDLYRSASTVVDAEGILTHVYVRSVMRSDEEFKYFTNRCFDAIAYTNVWPLYENENVCYSQYGAYTITITVSNCAREILALAHEIAHVLYIVPNLKSYSAFIERINHQQTAKLYGRGHHPNDPSCRHMKSVEKRFEERYSLYLANQRISQAL